jgi:hypothetical protein
MSFFLEGVYVKIGSMWVLVFSLMTGGLGFFLEPKGIPAIFFSSKKHVLILSLGSRERSTYLLEDGCANDNTNNFILLLVVV